MLCAGGSPAYAQANVDARLLRDPAVSKTHIAFVYAGDIWVVPKAGGPASRLSSPPGEESAPRFSPDGKHLFYLTDREMQPFYGSIDPEMWIYANSRRPSRRPPACS